MSRHKHVTRIVDSSKNICKRESRGMKRVVKQGQGGLAVFTSNPFCRVHQSVKQDGNIHQHGAVLNVVEVIFDRLVNRVLAIRTELPKAGDTLRNGEARRLPRSVFLCNEWHLGPRPDQGSYLL